MGCSGRLNAVKWEVRVNRLDHVKVHRATDQWAQCARGVCLVAWLVCCRTADEAHLGDPVSLAWDQFIEANPHCHEWVTRVKQEHVKGTRACQYSTSEFGKPPPCANKAMGKPPPGNVGSTTHLPRGRVEILSGTGGPCFVNEKFGKFSSVH